MRIAFASCMTPFRFPSQPAWNDVALANPDELVLLGDSVYYDADGASTGEVKAMNASQFAAHAHFRLSRQLAVPEFRALVGRPVLRTHAIWDDHDFLWNNACGAEVAGQPDLRHLVPPARAMFAVYRKALSAHLAPGSFPASPPPFGADTPAPGYSNVVLRDSVLLHLTDGRSFKGRLGRRALLGTAQFDAMEAAMQAADVADPTTVHLVASGVVFEARHGECWLDCEPEYNRMLGLATRHRILMLSGDIHDNNVAAYALPGGKLLFEATSSGAAVKTAVTIGTEQRNYGLLDIDAHQVQVRIFKFGDLQFHIAIDRATWQGVAPQD